MSEFTLAKNSGQEMIEGLVYGDYTIRNNTKWRKNGRTYVEVECPHKQDIVLLDNLRRGNQLGCDICFRERNGLPVFSSEDQRSLWYRVHSVFLRCYNADTNGYELYGARGIGVHKPWHLDKMGFVNYLEGLPNYDLTRTIDRIDGKKDYEPGNLRWATKREQDINKHNTVTVDFRGRNLTIPEFAREYCDVVLSRVRVLMKKGWSLEDIAAYKSQQRKK